MTLIEKEISAGQSSLGHRDLQFDPITISIHGQLWEYMHFCRSVSLCGKSPANSGVIETYRPHYYIYSWTIMGVYALLQECLPLWEAPSEPRGHRDLQTPLLYLLMDNHGSICTSVGVSASVGRAQRTPGS